MCVTSSDYMLLCKDLTIEFKFQFSCIIHLMYFCKGVNFVQKPVNRWTLKSLWSFNLAILPDFITCDFYVLTSAY